MINSKIGSLAIQLEEKKSMFEAKASDLKKKVYSEGIQAVEKSGLLTSALNIGDLAPDFTLINASGK